MSSLIGTWTRPLAFTYGQNIENAELPKTELHAVHKSVVNIKSAQLFSLNDVIIIVNSKSSSKSLFNTL